MNEIKPSDVERAVSGDRVSIEQLLKSLERPVFHLALRMLMSHHDAEDATQEVLLKIVTRLSTFRGKSLFSTWAWSVATRSILDYRRAQNSRPKLSFEDFEKDLATNLDLAAPERIEDIVYLGQIKVGCARALLQCLDTDHRIAYVMGEILSVDQSEAALALRVSDVAFRKRLGRARAKIASVLQKLCGVVNEDAQCRCYRRLRPGRKLGRLDRKDSSDLNMSALRAQVRRIDN